MGKRGAKRKYHKNIPKHIDQGKLPDRCYWDPVRLHWYTLYFDPESVRRRRRIAGSKAKLSDLHEIIESFSSDKVDTFRWLANKYMSTPKFKSLSRHTKKSYENSYSVVKAKSTKINDSLADVALKYWDKSLVQFFIYDLYDTPSTAKHVFEFIRVVFNWGHMHELCTEIHFKHVELPRQRNKQTLPSQAAFEALRHRAKSSGTYGQKFKGSCPHYIWAVMEIEYLCRLRGVELRTMSESQLTPEGLIAHRRKGSNTNITEWNDRLRAAVDYLISARDKIWAARKIPIPLTPETRPLVVNTFGMELKQKAYDSAWQRFVTGAIKDGVIRAEDRFSLHDLKRKGITDTVGSRQDKMDASGHKDPRMMDVYDKSMSVVKPASD